MQMPAGAGQQLTARFITSSPDKLVIVLDRERAVIGKSLVSALGLTGREGEILYWISEAKADREIAATPEFVLAATAEMTLWTSIEDVVGRFPLPTLLLEFRS